MPLMELSIGGIYSSLNLHNCKEEYILSRNYPRCNTWCNSRCNTFLKKFLRPGITPLQK